jgi:polyisoprenoid-binding protein YceI
MSTWTIDQAHTTIGFKVKHLVVSTVRGSFTDFSGTIESPDDTFEGASASFTAKTASVETHNDMRNGHLKSADFFDAENFPTISFASTSFKKNGDAFTLIGNLTMHGVTKEISLSGTFGGIAVGIDGKRMASFEATGTIDRRDFGLMYSAVVETGALVVSNEITLDLTIEAKES